MLWVTAAVCVYPIFIDFLTTLTLCAWAGFNVDPVVQDIKEALERERIAEQAVGWNVILFPTPVIKRMLMAGICTAITQQAVGIDASYPILLDRYSRNVWNRI